MFNGSYKDSSTRPCAPGQGPSPFASDSRSVVSVSGLPPSGLEFQGAQYDFAQPGPQSRVFSNSQAPTSHVKILQQNAFQRPMTVPLIPGNSSQSQVYGVAPPFENHTNTTANTGASSSGPYVGSQSLQTNAHSARKTKESEVAASFNRHQQTETAATYSPPPPDPYATPNAQEVYNYLWQLSHIWTEHEGSDELRLVIQLKKVRSA